MSLKFPIALDWALRASSAGNYDLKRTTITFWRAALQPAQTAGQRRHPQDPSKIQIERKTFIFTLKENPRGRFLRITEDVGGRRDTIIIPAPGLEEFKKLLDEMVKAAIGNSGEDPAMNKKSSDWFTPPGSIFA